MSQVVFMKVNKTWKKVSVQSVSSQFRMGETWILLLFMARRMQNEENLSFLPCLMSLYRHDQFHVPFSPMYFSTILQFSEFHLSFQERETKYFGTWFIAEWANPKGKGTMKNLQMLNQTNDSDWQLKFTKQSCPCHDEQYLFNSVFLPT